MTNNPTIDGVSRELLAEAALTLRLAGGNDGLAEDLRALLDAPVVERQPLCYQARHSATEPWFFTDKPGYWEWRPVYTSPPEVAALQSRIDQLEAEAMYAAAGYQAARDRIKELESGSGEPKTCDESNKENAPTFMGEPNPQHSIDWYREGISKHWKTICEQRGSIERLTIALKFYADREHYSVDDGLNWDSCSGEPSNILWHESEPWCIEDGYIARACLDSTAALNTSK